MEVSFQYMKYLPMFPYMTTAPCHWLSTLHRKSILPINPTPIKANTACLMASIVTNDTGVFRASHLRSTVKFVLDCFLLTVKHLIWFTFCCENYYCNQSLGYIFCSSFVGKVPFFMYAFSFLSDDLRVKRIPKHHLEFTTP